MISLLLPTRRRPHNLSRVLDSIQRTATEIPEIICWVDDDDNSYDDFDHEHVYFFSGPRMVLSETWNKCAERAHGDILMMCGDDMVFKTPSWDAMIEDAFADCPDKIQMVHGDDGMAQNCNFGAFPTIHRRWVDTVGYFVPPVFQGDYADTWLNDVANALGRRKHLTYLTEHLHPAWNKAPKDQTYEEKWERDRTFNPSKVYEDMISEREGDVHKLQSAIDQWQPIAK
jgi:hypothetical protein